MSDDPFGFDTRQLHAGQRPDSATGARATPIYQSASFVFESAEDAVGLFNIERAGHVYSRLSNPTNAVLEERIAVLDQGVGAIAVASGQAALHLAISTLMGAGDHIVASTDVYGGTYGLMTEELPRFGIETTMADMRDPSSYEAAIQPNTKILYIETLTNPVLKVCDIPAMVEVAKRHNLMCIIDNTFASPWACQPLTMGVDLVIHSTTKYLGGHSDIIGGAVVGSKKHIAQIFPRKVHFGASPDPHNCYLLERGMRTLHVRMPTLCSNAATLAQRLEAHPMIERVNHISLESHDDYEVAKRVMPKGTGMIGFVVKGGDEAALKFMRGLTMIYEATSLGGVESLVECPFNSSHMMIPEDVRHAAGLVPGFVRMSIGIEDVEDLWADIERGFANI